MSTENNESQERVTRVPLADIFAPNFLEYALSVVKDRALPDVRDGLKPVHRRILYSLEELGITPEKGYKKSARTVGDVLGKYHPHGDTSVYEAMVILAQEFSTRYMLVDGHGNFGSVDGDGAAAMRYTEAKLSKIGNEALKDIHKNTVDFMPNYDGEEQEPTVLPTLLPLLLMNGSFGIAVGLATKIPSHNLSDIYRACYYIIDKMMAGEEPDEEEVIKLIKAPDFPTGGTIIGLQGVKEGYRTGRGKFALRSKYRIEENGDIVIYEIPYKVNKADMIYDIKTRSNKYKTKKGVEKEPDFPQIKEIRDESDKEGMRIVIELKKDANSTILINNLIKNSDFQVNFNMNLLALVDKEPKQLRLYEMIEHFLAHASSVIIRRSEFILEKDNARLNIINGILKLYEPDPENEDFEIFDRVIDIIRTADSPVQSMIEYGFNEAQANYIIDMKLRSLTKVSKEKLMTDKEQLEAEVKKLNDILNDDNCLLLELKSNFEELEHKYSDERRTDIVLNEDSIEDEDLIEDETLIVTYTTDGIIKAVEEKEYKSQKRGGKGVKATNTKDDESIRFMFTSNSKDDLLFFTTEGRCHILKAYSLGKSSKTAKGKSINNYLNLNLGEKIVSMINANLKDKENNLLFVTKQGYIKKLALENLSKRFNVTKVISFKNEDDTLVQALLVKDENVVLATSNGYSLRLDSTKIKAQGRGASGVIGIKLSNGSEVIDMNIIKDNDVVLTVTEKGLAKKTKATEWNVIGRGGKGVKAHNLTGKTGNLVAILTADEDDELFIATSQGQITRINTNSIRVCSRSSVGVKAINLSDGDSVVSVSINKASEEVEENKEQE